jgi:hypothetical protein
MVRASTLALHLNLVETIVGMEFVAVANANSALWSAIPRFTNAAGLGAGLARACAQNPIVAFVVSVYGSLLIVSGVCAAMKIRDRTTRVGERQFALSHVATAVNCVAHRARVPAVFPLGVVFHVALAALFHLGDGYRVPVKFPSLLGRATKTEASARKAAKKPSKKSSSTKAKRAAPVKRASSRKSRQ